MRVLSRWRPELIFLAALLVFGVVLALRTLQAQLPAPASVAVESSAPPPQALELGDPQMITQIQERIRREPDNTDAYAMLGIALLQRVRETADPTLYVQAEQAFAEALKRDPQHIDSLIGRGSLALSLHQFKDALAWGEKARAANPYRPQIYGILGDAHVELGQYDEAFDAVQKMIDMRPDLSSYSRASYMRELQGDTEGAIELMQQAVEAGNPQAESALWTRVQLGHLYFNRGDLHQAEQSYRQALQIRPNYIFAQAGLARIQAALGRHSDAIAAYTSIVERLPLPEFVIALGELYEVSGQNEQAQEQYKLVRAMQQLNANAGMDVDLELALFDADHGADPARALERARAAYERRPSIYAADALAWSLYKSGDFAEARRYSQEALRLGTRDAALHFRAGMIAYALGDTTAAREQLQTALNINPNFSIRSAPEAKKLLERLGA